MKLGKFREVVADADAVIQSGADTYQQFLCAKCGVKQTMDVPNKFYTKGTCEECGHETNIEQDGCNYMVIRVTKL